MKEEFHMCFGLTACNRLETHFLSPPPPFALRCVCACSCKAAFAEAGQTESQGYDKVCSPELMAHHAPVEKESKIILGGCRSILGWQS